MAHGFVQSFNAAITVASAGTQPAERVHPLVVKVMKEAGVDISDHTPRSVAEFLSQPWDYVVTVCDGANETCPAFAGKVGRRLHISFEDPSKAVGSDEFVLSEFRRVRDDIKKRFYEFYINTVCNEEQ